MLPLVDLHRHAVSQEHRTALAEVGLTTEQLEAVAEQAVEASFVR